MASPHLLYVSSVLAVATTALAIAVAVYAVGLAELSELWVMCIALWILTTTTAFFATIYVYDIQRNDPKLTCIVLSLIGLFVVIVLLYVPISENQSHIKLHRYRDCVYRELEGRYCNEFPADVNDITTLGAIGASVSSLMFIICALIAFGYEAHRIAKRDAITLLKIFDMFFLFLMCGFYVYVGSVSTGFHATHCYDWWRMDIGAVRAFPYIAAVNVLSATITNTYENQVKWHSLSLTVPLFVYTFTKQPFWTETENTATIVAPGIAFCAVALARDVFWRWLQTKKGQPRFGPAAIVGLWLVGGSVILIAQGEPGACDAPAIFQPVALAHLTLAMTPIAIAFLRDGQVRYMTLM